MNKFFEKGDIVKFNSDFFNTYTNIIAGNTGVPHRVIELVKTHYFEQPFRVITKSWDGGSVKIDAQINNATGANINRWWWRTKWLDLFERQEIYIDQKEVIKLI